MKDSETAEMPLFGAARAGLNIVELNRDKCFSDLSVALGLNASKAFRNADLAGVDFSHSNLSGFDFTGSDLRGAFGVNVHTDRTTIFENADVGGSIFANDLKLRTYFADKYLDREYWLLKNGHWADAIVAVGKNLMKRGEAAEKFSLMAQRLFFETDDPVVRTDMLYSLQRALGKDKEHFEFLIKVISAHSASLALVAPALRVVADFYYNERAAFEISMNYVRSRDKRAQDAALQCVVRSKFFWTRQGDIMAIVAAVGGAPLRRFIVGKFARRRGQSYVDSVTELYTDNYLDYIQTVTLREIASISRRIVVAKDMGAKVIEISPKFSIDHKLYGGDLEKTLTEVRTRLEELKSDGIPFVIEKEPG